ncbi:hypothetical protein J3T99_01540 [Acetobacteraceae bacterium B3987]|nr:hypothetical protein [Acetobacteraceae bacterium B3987]
MQILRNKDLLFSYIAKALPNLELTHSDLEHITSWEDVKKFTKRHIVAKSEHENVKIFNKRFSNAHHPTDSLKKMVKKYVFF